MTARRPNVPRAGRPSPQAEERPAAGSVKGQTPARGSRAPGASVSPGPGGGSGTGSRAASRASGHGVGATASVEPRTGTSAQRRPTNARAAGSSATKDPRTVPGVAAGTTSTRGPRTDATAGGPPTSRSTSASASSAPASPSAARAAERSQLAGSIRSGRLGSRRAESPIQPAEEATTIPAKTFSGRLLALAVVLIAVIVLLAPSVSRYVQQQADVDALRADIARLQDQQANYQSELARWEDPAFVKQQARERIFLVMQGETRYLVKGGGGIEAATGEGSAAGPADLPWVDSLWNSVARAATD